MSNQQIDRILDAIALRTLRDAAFARFGCDLQHETRLQPAIVPSSGTPFKIRGQIDRRMDEVTAKAASYQKVALSDLGVKNQASLLCRKTLFYAANDTLHSPGVAIWIPRVMCLRKMWAQDGFLEEAVAVIELLALIRDTYIDAKVRSSCT
jgi:hypothetical protein